MTDWLYSQRDCAALPQGIRLALFAAIECVIARGASSRDYRNSRGQSPEAISYPTRWRLLAGRSLLRGTLASQRGAGSLQER